MNDTEREIVEELTNKRVVKLIEVLLKKGILTADEATEISLPDLD